MGSALEGVSFGGLAAARRFTAKYFELSTRSLPERPPDWVASILPRLLPRWCSTHGEVVLFDITRVVVSHCYDGAEQPPSYDHLFCSRSVRPNPFLKIELFSRTIRRTPEDTCICWK